MSYVQCPNCHTEVSGSLLVCPSCNGSLATAERYEKVPLAPAPAPADPSARPPASISRQPDPATLNILRVEATFKNGAGWFYWIAGLSLVNSILFRMGTSFVFIFGLGLSQIIDAMAQVASEDIPRIALPLQAVSIILNAAILALFAALGWLARRRHAWAFVVGLAVYALDAIVLIAFKDYLGLAFHLWVFFSLLRGLQALHQLNKLTVNRTTVA